MALSDIANELCSCGGRGPSDPDACDVCKFYHAAKVEMDARGVSKMSAITHKHLISIMPRRPGDYKPWGDVDRWEDPHVAYPDCSCGCKWFIELSDESEQYGRPVRGGDMGVCCNPESHRVGLLTFEHQGCMKFDADTDEDDDPEPEGGELVTGQADAAGNVSVSYKEKLR